MASYFALGRLIIFTIALWAASSAVAQGSAAAVDKALDDNLGEHVQMHQVFFKLQQAVAKQDAAAVAALVNYPLRVKVKGKTVIIRTPQTFVSKYDSIMTPEIAGAVERQKYDDLFVNDQGAMFGDGQVWLAGVCKDKGCEHPEIRIRTIQSTAERK